MIFNEGNPGVVNFFSSWANIASLQNLTSFRQRGSLYQKAIIDTDNSL